MPTFEWLTWPEAAELVGCPVPTIDWYSRQGRIQTRPHDGNRPTVSRESVEEFAIWWHERQAEREEKRAANHRRCEASQPPAPTGWLTTERAAEILGVSQVHVRRLGREGTFRMERRGRRMWVDEADVRALAGERAPWMSMVAASRLAGCAENTIQKAVREGRIRQRETSNNAIPSLERTSVEKFVAQRAAEARARERRRNRADRRRVRPPDDGHVWLDTTTTALVLGVSRKWVYQLAQDERIPSTVSSGRRWFRRDLVEQRAAAVAFAHDAQSDARA